MILLVITISCLALLFAVYLARYVLQQEMGTEKMQEISNAIKEGAEAFLSRQNRTIATFAAILAAVIFALYAYVRTPSPADPMPPVQMAFWTTLSFVLGAACSVIAGYIGMWIAIRSNIRTAAAVRSSLNEALRIALRGGAVSGLFVVAMSLLGVGGLYALLGAVAIAEAVHPVGVSDPEVAMQVEVCAPTRLAQTMATDVMISLFVAMVEKGVATIVSQSNLRRHVTGSPLQLKRAHPDRRRTILR